MIVVCDTFSWKDYPVFCSEAEFNEKHREHSDVNMQRVMEVYDLSMNREHQLAESRAFHYPPSYYA